MGPLWKRGVNATVFAAVGNLVVWWLGVSLLPIPADFPPLAGAGPTIFFTTVGALGAAAVFAIVRRVGNRPGFLFRRIAAVVLLFSFIPDLWLLTASGRDAVPGANAPAVILLMILHVVAAGVIVWALTGGEGEREEG